MQEKVKGFFEKVKQWWKAATKKVKILLGAGLLAVLAAIAVVVMINANQPYVTLFTGLNQSDMTSIVAFLSDNGVTDYQISGEDTILVPKSQESSLKAALLTAGYPSSGYAYSTYFDNVGMLTTETERNQLILYELQDRTAAVIRNMDGVQDAVVQFTQGEDRTYVLDSNNVVEASAYVMVTMKDGKTLEKSQAEGIRNLLSRSLQGLKVENIDVLDSYGNTYSSNDTLTDLQDTSALKLELEEQVNNKVRTGVMQVLIPLFGAENVQVTVNSVVNVDRTYTDSTDYTLEDWANDGSTGGEGIIGKKIYDQQIVRDDEETAGGNVGTETNADVPTYPEDQVQPDGTENAYSNSGEKDYLVDHEVQQVEHVAGTISDVMVSVTINEEAADEVNEADLYPHIARAAGIGTDVQRDKVHILIAPFYQATTDSIIPEVQELPMWVLYAAIGGGVLFLLLLILIMLLVRHNKKKRAKLLAEQMAAEAAAVVPETPPAGADIMEMQTEKSVELRQDVRKFADENPEIAAQMVKSWLREGEGTE